MKSCFFIGHREASEEIFPELAEAVERHIVDYGVTEFIVGNYGGFDRMAARAVMQTLPYPYRTRPTICSTNRERSF